MEVVCHHVGAVCIATDAHELTSCIEGADALCCATAATIGVAARLPLEIDECTAHLGDL